MKTFSAVVALLLSLTVIPSTLADAPPDDGLPPCCRKDLQPGKPLADGSIYQLESKWTSDVGREVQLRVLRGKPQIVVMFFANCQWACPLLVHDLKRIEAALPDDRRKDVGFVLVSFDSKRDTVEALHAYRLKNELANANWTLLRGNPDDIRELAAVLGVNFREDIPGQFVHSNLITVLNREGEITGQVKGLNQPTSSALELLKKADAK
ncbi:SCO family protein [bacterium]|nr:SCO family protein [bacterium]